MPQSLAQKRATDSLNNIELIRDLVSAERIQNGSELFDEDLKEITSGNEYGKFNSYVQSLPASIMMVGLGQAVATLLASAKLSVSEEKRKPRHRAYKILYKILSNWLCRNSTEAPYGDTQDVDLLDAITSHDERAYLKAQAEAMAYLEWLKKFSNAYLDTGG